MRQWVLVFSSFKKNKMQHQRLWYDEGGTLTHLYVCGGRMCVLAHVCTCVFVFVSEHLCLYMCMSEREGENERKTEGEIS